MIIEIEADILRAETYELFSTIKHEEIAIVNKIFTPKEGVTEWWQCPIKEVRPMYYSSIYRGAFQHTPSDMKMVIYDCDGLMSMTAWIESGNDVFNDDIHKAVGEFLNRCMSEGVCLFAVSLDDIFIGPGRGQAPGLIEEYWRVYIKGVSGREVLIIGAETPPNTAKAIIAALNEAAATIKPLEVWIIWHMIHKKVEILTMAEFDSASGLYRGERGGNYKASYKALWGLIGCDLNALLDAFWKPEWQIWWGLGRHRHLDSPIAEHAINIKN